MDYLDITKFIIQGTHQEEVFKADQSDIPGWVFPDLCACCGGPPAGTIRKKLKAGDVSLITPLAIPYCAVCLKHVRTRSMEMTIAFAIGITTFFISLWAILYLRSGGDIGGKLAEGIVIETVCAIGMGIVSGLVFLKSLSKPLPQTPDCTVPLEVTMKGLASEILSSTVSGKSTLQIEFLCANQAFSDEFRELNQQNISQETSVPARLHRTRRGDLKLARIIHEH